MRAMATLRGLPPGRAGRVWLAQRTEVAERGGTLLETKLRILAAEQQRVTLRAERTQQRWEQAVVEAERWMARASLLGGQRGVRLATDGPLADTTLAWETTMGVTYPAGARTTLPEAAPDAPTPDSSALVHAQAAYREAVVAAGEHGAATAALAAVEAEVAATRRRLRAIQDRWLPRLAGAARQLAEALEEQEREEGMRMRWAAARLGREAR